MNVSFELGAGVTKPFSGLAKGLILVVEPGLAPLIAKRVGSLAVCARRGEAPRQAMMVKISEKRAIAGHLSQNDLKITKVSTIIAKLI